MIESEPRGFGRRTAERIVPEVRHHQQQSQEEHNPRTEYPQSQDTIQQVQQEIQRLDIRSDNNDIIIIIKNNNTDQRYSNSWIAAGADSAAAPASSSSAQEEEEDAGVIRVSVTTTTTVSEAGAVPAPAPAQGATPTPSPFDINRNWNRYLNLTTRPSNNATTNYTTATNNYNNMGLAYNVYLNSGKIYGCRNCKTHLANHEDIISRNFRGQHGKAYLFNSVVNVETGDAGERNMTTGRHVVRDIYCRQCKEVVGWKYDKAYEPSEKYKEGKFILEAELLANVN